MSINKNLLDASFAAAKRNLQFETGGASRSQIRVPYTDNQIKSIISNVWESSGFEAQSNVIERVTVEFLTTFLIDRLYNGPLITDLNAFNIDLGEIFRKFIERIRKY